MTGHAGGTGAPPRVLYGRRKGHRLRAGQRARLAARMPEVGLTLPLPGSPPLRPAALFPRPMRAVWLEVGFGAGEHLAWQAAAHRDVGFVGCEPYVNGVASLLRALDEAALDNVRVVAGDARALLDALPAACLGRAFVLFPDPWPKSRHHKRRFIAAGNLDALARALADDAELRLATDHMGYARWMLWHLTRHRDFAWCARRPADWRQRPSDWPETRYERKSVAAGRPSVYLIFRRRRRAESA